MPSDEASRCCSIVSNWCWSSRGPAWPDGAAAAAGTPTSANDFDLLGGVVIRLVGDDGSDREVLGGRRRRGVPLETRRAPWVCGRGAAVPHRLDQVDHGDLVTRSQV